MFNFLTRTVGFIPQLVEYKHSTLLEEKKKQALDQHLSFIVGETEKFSSLVAESMNKPAVQPGGVGDAADRPAASLSDGKNTILIEQSEVCVISPRFFTRMYR